MQDDDASDTRKRVVHTVTTNAVFLAAAGAARVMAAALALAQTLRDPIYTAIDEDREASRRAALHRENMDRMRERAHGKRRHKDRPPKRR